MLAFRRVKCADFVFNDQEEVQRFLDLSEDNKKLFTPESYCAVQGAILNNLHFIWQANRPLTGRHLHDNRALGNDLIDGRRTAWLDKYTMETATVDDTSYSHFPTISGGLKPSSYTTYHLKRGAY